MENNKEIMKKSRLWMWKCPRVFVCYVLSFKITIKNGWMKSARQRENKVEEEEEGHINIHLSNWTYKMDLIESLRKLC